MDDQVFDDGSEVEIECGVEEPGDLLCVADLSATDEEMAAGEFLAAVIDPDDDYDNGSQWGTVESPTMTAYDFAVLSGWTKEGPPS